MKKFIGLAVVAVMIVFSLSVFTGCTPRTEMLKVHNWGEYMDESLLEDFESYYLEKTGKKVTVKPSTFENNETMYTDLSMNETDYDLICPSEYMVERMKREELLLELDRNIIKPEEFILPSLVDNMKTIDPEQKYAVPYMWGTFGVMYNKEILTKEAPAKLAKVDSWSTLFSLDGLSKGKISMKDSVRDCYAVANIFKAAATLSEKSNGFTEYGADYMTELKKAFNDTSDATIQNVENTLKAQKTDVGTQFESDQGKVDMMNEATNAPYLGLYWSCDAGYVMMENEEGGIENPGNKNLWYSVPKEGSNVYCDAFVIPKYAENTDAANWFLRWLCEEKIATANMLYAGASTPVISAFDSYKATLEADEDGMFEGTAEGWKEMYIEMMFPTDKTLNRCAFMRDFGDANAKTTEMWARVRT